MRIVTPIVAPFPGEHAVAVEPRLSPEVLDHWNVRLNLYTGRALSHTALEHEQQGRAGRLATRGQMVSPGIVNGLEVSVEREDRKGDNGASDKRPVYYYHIAAGMGLTATGEDVIVRRSLRVNVLDVRVCGPAGLFEKKGGASGPYQVRWRLEQLLNFRVANGLADHDLPRVGVLLLQPVEREELAGGFDATDPCEEDPQNYAFEDRQLVDGCRLLWYVWPREWRLPKADRTYRNQLAYAIFDAELANGPDDLMPWDTLGVPGVPLAVVAFNRRWKRPLFVDRYAVARAGGKPRPRTSLRRNAGSPFLWQARLEQFTAEVADARVPDMLPEPKWDRSRFDLHPEADPRLTDLAQQFRFLPPAGLLPRRVLNFVTRNQSFFPSTYRIDAFPVPLEQLDVAMEGSAALAPFDTFVPDEVQLLVPVPQAWFEPNLLEHEVVSPSFYESIDAFVRRRSKWLLRRLMVRQYKAAIDRAKGDGEEIYPQPDPNAVDDDEAVANNQIDLTVPALARPEESFGTNVTDVGSVASALTRLRAYLTTETPLSDEVSRVYFDAEKIRLNSEQVRSRLKAINGRITYDSELRNLIYAARPEPMNETERDQLKALAPTNDAYVVAIVSLWETSNKAALAAPPPVGGAALNVNTTSVVPLAGLPFPRSYLAEVASGKVWYDQVKEQLAYTARPEPMSVAERDAAIATLEVVATEAAHAAAAEQAAQAAAVGVLLPLDADFAPAPAAPPALSDALVARRKLQVATSTAAVRALYSRSQRSEVMQLDRLGLRKFIDYLAKKIAAADDKVDLSFTRVQTDIYRLRQLMLGSDAATRLATSPVLASIAKGESAFATQENLKEFVKEAKEAKEQSGVELPEKSAYIGSRPTIESRLPLPPVPADSGTAPGVPLASRLRMLGRPVAANVFAAPLLAARAPIAPAPALPRPGATKQAVVGQAAIIGRPLDFRSVTVAERLEQPKAPEAKNSAVATKASVIADLTALDINGDDLEIPGFNPYGADAKLIVGDDDFILHGTSKVRRVLPKETRYTLFEIAGRGLVTEILQGYHDLDPVDGDESAFFAIGVRALDHAVAALRIVEGRIQTYNAVLDRCRQTLAELEGLRARTDARLQVIEGELAETRHDVSVSRALLAEEEARVAAINERRERIIAEHVPFLAFRRPRSTDLLEAVPTRHLDPAAVEPALPACLMQRMEVPAELRAMVNLFREVPVRWFAYVADIVDRLDRLEMMHQALHYARMRAALWYQARPALGPGASSASGVGLAASIQRLFAAHQDIVSQLRAQTAQFDLSELAGQSWQRARARAREALSLGDLADADHGRSEVARAATQELETISRVAACLYARFGEVRPQIRLEWAEQLSQYDEAVDLRNLATLPRWDAIEYLDRRELQGLADWLFERVDPAELRAAAMMSDLVRLCILLASHAPVNQIVAGHVQQPAAVQQGARVELAADLAKVHVGMQVLLYADGAAGAKVVARGVVEDLGDGKVAARVIHATSPTVNLSANARVQFVERDDPNLTSVDHLGARKLGGFAKLGARVGALVGRPS